MSKKIKIDNLSKEINSILTSYEKDVVTVTKEETNKVTTNALKILKKHAPERTGKYKKTLARRKVSENSKGIKNILYAKKSGYQLTHLLEHGHLTRKGNRTKAIPHFKYADEYIQENLYKNIGERIENK